MHDEKTSKDIADALASSQETVDRAVTWMLGRIGTNGDPGAAHGHYYRLPWALAITGRRSEASAVLAWIVREALTDCGDLRRGGPRAGFETRWSTYPLANLATGAWHLERYDVARRITRRLHAYQHPESGGAYAAHPDHRTDERQDLFPTAQLGMTGLTTGDMDLADGAYAWTRQLLRSQPDLPNKLYTATDGTELIIEANGDADLEWQVITDFRKPRQAFYNPGIAAAFMGRYHMATGSEEALSLARQYLELTVSGTPEQFDFTQSVQVCKFAWGASVLLEATGENQYLQQALSMSRWFSSSQRADGSWDNSPFLMSRTDDALSVRMEITAEFVQHLITIITAVAGENRTQSKQPSCE